MLDVVGGMLSFSFYEGLVFGLVAIGVYLTLRVLAFPDLTVDGSYTLGGAVAAVLIVAGVHPFLASLAAIGAGRKAFAYGGLRLATSTRNVVEIVRKKGLNLVISPSNEMFLEQLNQARQMIANPG